jgi:hypothetical protein|nr:MAG TPA: hypothetical protein [Caudoviricetes sp.]
MTDNTQSTNTQKRGFPASIQKNLGRKKAFANELKEMWVKSCGGEKQVARLNELLRKDDPQDQEANNQSLEVSPDLVTHKEKASEEVTGKTSSDACVDAIKQVQTEEAIRSPEVILANKKAPEESIGVGKTSSGAMLNEIKQIQTKPANRSTEDILAKQNALVEKKNSKKSAITFAKRNLRIKFENVHGSLGKDEFLVINNYRRRVAKVRNNKDGTFTILGVYYATAPDFKQLVPVSKEIYTLFKNGVEDAYKQHLQAQRKESTNKVKYAKADAKSDENYKDYTNIRPNKWIHESIKKHMSGDYADFNSASMDFFTNVALPDAHRLASITVMDSEGNVVYEKVFKTNHEPKDFKVTLNLANMSPKDAGLSPEQFIANTLFATNALMSLQEADKHDGHKFFDRNLMSVVMGKIKRFTIYRYTVKKDTGEIVSKKQPSFNAFIEAFGLSCHKSQYGTKSCIRHLQAYKNELLGKLVLVKILKENLGNMNEVSFDSREKAILSNANYWEGHYMRWRYSVVAGSAHTELAGKRKLQFVAKTASNENHEGIEVEGIEGDEPIVEKQKFYNVIARPELDEFMETMDTARIPKLLHNAIQQTNFSVDKTFSEMVSQAKELYAEYVFEQNLDYLDARKFNENMEIRDERVAAAAEDEALWLKSEFNATLLQVKKFLRDVTTFASLVSHSYKDENGVIHYVPAFTLSTSGRLYEKLGLWGMTREMKELFFGSGCVNVDAMSCHPSIVINVVVEAHKKGFIKLSQKDIDELAKQAKRVNNKHDRTKLCERTGCSQDSLKKCINSIYNFGKTSYSETRISEFGEAGKKNLGSIERLIAENNLTESGKKEILAFLQPFADAMKKLADHIHALYTWRNARENTPEGYVNMGLYMAEEGILDGLTPSQLMAYFLQSEETLLTARTAIRLYKESNGKIRVLSHEHDGMVLSIVGVDELTMEQRAYIADKADKAYKAESDKLYPSKAEKLAMREKYFYSAETHPYKVIKWDYVDASIKAQVAQIIAPKEGEVLELPEQKRYDFEQIRKNNETIIKQKLIRNYAALNNYEWEDKYDELVEAVIQLSRDGLRECKKAKVPNDLRIGFILDEVKSMYEYMQAEIPEEDIDAVKVIIYKKLLVGEWVVDEKQSLAEQKAAAQFANHKTCL